MLKEHKPTWNDIQNKPDNLANSGNIQDLQRKIDQINSVLSQKASSNHTHNWSDIQSKPSINKSDNVYTIPGLGGNIEIPSWVTQTKPTYDWSEIQNKPEIDIELKYKRLTEVTGNITDLLKDKPGVFRVGDSARLQGMPNEDWYHFFGGRHYNRSEQRNYYFALRSHTVDNYFWLGRQNNTENVEWFKFVGFKDLNNNKLFREWNLEHGLSAYIGNSNVFNIRTGFSGGASDLLFGVQNDKVVVPTYLESANELKGSELWLDTDKNGNVTRFRANNDTLTIGNKEWNDLKYLYTKGIKIWGNTDDNKVVLAGGGTIHRKNLVSKVIQVTTHTFDITGDNVGQTAHVATNCVLNYNTMPELSTFAVRKIYDGGSVTFSGSLPPIYTGDTVLNGKKGSTAIIDYGLNNQIFIDIRNI